MHPLEKYMADKGLTQKELADILKVDKGNLSKIISGKGGISRLMSRKIKGELDIDIPPTKLVKNSLGYFQHEPISEIDEKAFQIKVNKVIDQFIKDGRIEVTPNGDHKISVEDLKQIQLEAGKIGFEEVLINEKGKNKDAVAELWKNTEQSESIKASLDILTKAYLKETSFNIKSKRTESEPKANARSLGELPHADDINDTPFIELPGGDLLMVMPLVTEFAYAGYMSGFSDPEYIESLPKHSIIVQNYHKGTYKAFEIVGDSMDNNSNESIPDKSRVTGRFLPKIHWTSRLHLHKFADFVIVSKTDGIIAKRITSHDVANNVITCHSLNPDKDSYPDFDINLEDVEELYNIVDVSRRRRL